MKVRYGGRLYCIYHLWASIRGFPDSSGGIESSYNAGDSSLISGLGRPAGEGIGYPLQWCSIYTVSLNPTHFKGGPV